MNVPDRVVLLVGPPCTGAEWLGGEVLTGHREIEVVGREITDREDRSPASAAAARLGEYISTTDGVGFEFDHARALLGEMLAEIGNGAVVLCEPGFGHGGYVDRMLIARRLRRVFGRCRAVITVTDPIEAVAAFYEKVRALGGVRQSFDAWVRGCIRYRHYDGRARDYPLTNAKFGELAEVYGRLFGRDGVHVVSVRALCEGTTGSLDGLARFLGVEPGGLSGSAGSVGDREDGGARSGMSASTRAWLGKYYAADQALLRRFVGG